MEQFAAVQPVLPSKNVTAAILFYQRLGFELRFQDALENPNYAGVGRDQVEIHIQSHAPEEWDRVERPMLRFKINDVEALFQEYKGLGVFHSRTELRTTAWHTIEFAFYDRDQNGLTFYKDV